MPALAGVKPADGWYVPLPDTVAVPIVVPLGHGNGSLVWGPVTVNVIVPPAPAAAPDSVALIEEAAIGAIAVSLAGHAALSVGVFSTARETIPLPHVLVEGLLWVSPL